LVAASLNQAALAQGQAHRAASRWILCAALFVVINLVAAGDPFRAVEVGYAACSALLALLLYAIYRRPEPRPEDRVAPGSAEEPHGPPGTGGDGGPVSSCPRWTGGT